MDSACLNEWLSHTTFCALEIDKYLYSFKIIFRNDRLWYPNSTGLGQSNLVCFLFFWCPVLESMMPVFGSIYTNQVVRYVDWNRASDKTNYHTMSISSVGALTPNAPNVKCHEVSKVCFWIFSISFILVEGPCYWGFEAGHQGHFPASRQEIHVHT